MEQLKAYLTPLREQTAALELEIGKLKEGSQQVGAALLPTETEVSAYAAKAREALRDLSFEQKRAIVLNTVESIVGTQKQLEVRGYIPVTTNTYGGFKTEDRHRRLAKRGEVHAF